MSSNDNATPKVLPGIVPRWEWRVFGPRFDAADELLAGLSPVREGASSEQYFLSVHTDASVKVRDGLMDVKVRLGVSDDGLELWAPTLKAEFPVSADDVESVLSVLGTEVPRPLASSYSLGELTELLDSDPDVRVVAVEKQRHHFRLDGVMVESTDIVVDGEATHTIAVESPDPDDVTGTMQHLGLGDEPNVGMARGLKAAAGFASTRLVVIDVGTNSVKYHLEEREADGSSRTLVDRSEVTRLGEGQTDDGVLADEPVRRTIDAISSMVADARERGPVDIVAVGTAGLRRASNRAVLVDAVRERVGVEVEVISGPEEARLAYLAATSALPAVTGRLAVFDSGGGSTQFTFGRDGTVDEQFSLYIGAVRVAEPFGLASVVSTETLDEAFEFVGTALESLDGRDRPDAIVAIGGTSTNLAAVSHGLATYDPDVVHGTVLDVEELDRQIEMYRTRSADERRSIPGLQPARAEVILGGACIVRTVLAKLGHDRMTVSDRGLRHGVVIDRFGG